MFAASIDDNSNITLPNNSDHSDNIINQKRHKKTQRKYPKMDQFNTDKVNSVLKQLHNNTSDDDDNIDEFKLLPPPESMSAYKSTPIEEKQESFSGMDFSLGSKLVGKAPSPTLSKSDDLELNNYNNYGDSKSIEEYYKRMLPGYQGQQNQRQQNQRQYHSPYPNQSQSQNHEYPSHDVLLQKLNYMISLLEDQQDEKTGNVTEEVILYSFLGIFVIFIADTFVRAGKYVR